MGVKNDFQIKLIPVIKPRKLIYRIYSMNLFIENRLYLLKPVYYEKLVLTFSAIEPK